MPDKVSVTKSKLDDLANAIGSKSGKGIPLTIDEMVDAVLSIETPLTQQIVTPDSGTAETPTVIKDTLQG